MSNRTVALDFDGVIHSYTSPWTKPGEIHDPPVPGSLQYACELLEHFDVTIFSARAKSRAGMSAMKKWLRQHWQEAGLPEDKLYRIEIVSEKPIAILYIDDRGFCFTGTFPSIEQIQNFKPWNRT